MMLGVDLDGVVCDFASKANAHIAKACGEHERPILRWDWYREYGPAGIAAFKEIMLMGAGRGFFSDLNPIPGALASLYRMLARGHEVIFLTHRPRMAEADTLTWLERWQLLTSQTRAVVVDRPEDKRGYAVDLLLDDRPETVGVARGGVLFVQPWNLHVSHMMPHVYNWSQFERLAG